MIGNRAFGGRIDGCADVRFLVAAYACLLLTPLVPMLFMGEEFAASTPFLYFCDFDTELAQAVSLGRRREFQRFAAFADEGELARIPDPNAAASFEASKLRWSERERAPHAERRALVELLLALRRERLLPHLARLRHGGRFNIQGPFLHLAWDLGDGSVWRALVHFAGANSLAPPLAGDVVFAWGIEAEPSGLVRFAPGCVLIAHDRPPGSAP